MTHLGRRHTSLCCSCVRGLASLFITCERLETCEILVVKSRKFGCVLYTASS